MVRLFVAIPTPAPILPRLIETRDLLRATRADVKWEPAEKLHCTIKFLGDTPEEMVSRIVDALGHIAVSTAPFTVCYSGTGCFPGIRDPRIIWAGIEDPEEGMGRLFGAIEAAMAAFGFETERRAFHPHVTLGRVKSRSGIPLLLERMETITLSSPPVVIQRMELIKSTLQPRGSVYSPVASLTLEGQHAGHPPAG